MSFISARLGSLSALATLPLLLTGCFYGYGTDASVARLTDARYPPTSSVELYFRPPTREEGCVPLALLDVEGSRFEETDSVLAKLRARATALGADAIFSVTAGSTARSQGELLGELDRRNKPTVYSSHVVTGLAARCDVRTTANTAPPVGAYGYTFGDRAVATAARCRAHGSQWFDSPPRCVGAPAAREGPIDFTFCNDALCRIEGTAVLSVHRPMDDFWPPEFVKVSADFLHRFGLPSSESSQAPRGCNGTRLLGCVAASKASFTYVWRWGTGESASLLLTADGWRPAIRTVYDVRAVRRGPQGSPG